MAEGTCIFCFKKKKYNKEHVISDAIGGSLILYESVCVCCNSWLGSAVDAELMKLPETVDAFEALGISYERDELLNRHYQAVGSAADREMRGRLINGDFRLHAQGLADGSKVFPEGDAWSALATTMQREAKKEGSGLSEEEIAGEITRLRDEYENAGADESIRSELFDRTIVKRSDALEVELRPKSKPRLFPVMAKIAYEFLFFVVGAKRLYVEAHAEVINTLLHMVGGEEQPNCMRMNPLKEGYKDVHGIRLEVGPNNCIFEIILFGNVRHILTAPALCEGSLHDLATIAKRDVKGVEYNQKVTTGDMNFCALGTDGSRIPISNE